MRARGLPPAGPHRHRYWRRNSRDPGPSFGRPVRARLWPTEPDLPAGRSRGPYRGPRLHRGSVDRSGACHPSSLDMAGDEMIARAESPAAASVGEDHDSERLRRKAEDSFKGKGPTRESYCCLIHCRPPGCILHFFHLSITDEGPNGCRHGPVGRNSRRFASHQSCRGGHGKTVRFIAAVIT